MKKIILSIVVAMLFAVTSFAQSTDASFEVRGDCGMCKTSIEKAATSIAGVTKAVWDKESKKIEVAFDASKTSELDIQKAIAAVGYDAADLKGNKEAHAKLTSSCKTEKKDKMCTDKKVCCKKKAEE